MMSKKYFKPRSLTGGLYPNDNGHTVIARNIIAAITQAG